jgi:hypothetical protein
MFIRQDVPVSGFRAGAGTVVDGVKLTNCEIFGCWVDVPPDPHNRAVFRNIEMVNNVFDEVSLEGVVVEDSTVDGVRTFDKLVLVNGCLFRHVTFKGFFEFVIVNPGLSALWSRELSDRYEKDNSRFWDSLIAEGDWALDISGVSGSLDLRGIPAQLIRRNPEVQAVMTFEQAWSGEWRTVPGILDSEIHAQIKFLLSSGSRDHILKASDSSLRIGSDREILSELRRIGMALPD